MSVKDQSGFYYAGAKALKALAARCGEARLARIFEAQAERFLHLAQGCDWSSSDAAPPTPPIPAKRPNVSRVNLPETRNRPPPDNVVDLPSARRRGER